MLGLPHGRACCVGARPLPTVGPAVSVCGPSQGRACCAGVRPAAWSSVLLCCVAPLMVGRAVLAPVRRSGCAWCGGAWLGLLSCVPPGGRHWVPVGGACGCVLAGAMRGLFCLFRVVFAALRLVCSGGCGRRLGCGCGCVDRLARVGSVLVRAPPHGWACCVCACPPPWGGVLCRCVPDPRGGACCVGAWPPSRWGVPCRCLSAARVCGLGCRHLLGGLWLRFSCWLGRGCCCVGACPPPVGACRVCAWPPPFSGLLCRRVRVSVRGVVAGWMPGWFCWFAVVSASVRPALSVVGCLWCLPGRGWCCAGARPTSWLGVLCWCVPPPPLVGRAVLVCGPLHGGACCVGLWSPSWWGVLCWCVPPSWLGVLCRCVPPPWWGVLRWFVVPLLLGRAVFVRAPLMLGHAVSALAPPGGGVWFGLSSSVGWVVVAVVLLAWPGLVLCWCVPPPLLGRAAFVRGPPLAGACCVGVFGFRFVVL